jgi:phosphoribosylpyrophosphate synthetase
MFPEYDQIICGKVREGDQRIVKISEGNPAGAHVVIVDDLVQSGGTLIACRDALKMAGASNVSAYVTHAVFPNDGHIKFAEMKDGFDHFFVTDSHPNSRKLTMAPFEVLPLVESLLDHVLSHRTKSENV